MKVYLSAWFDWDEYDLLVVSSTKQRAVEICRVYEEEHHNPDRVLHKSYEVLEFDIDSDKSEYKVVWTSEEDERESGS